MNDSANTVISASPMPIIMWTPIIAMSAKVKGVVPLIPSIIAVDAADTTTEIHAATKPPTIRNLNDLPTLRDTQYAP